jgi:hypothetical protein
MQSSLVSGCLQILQDSKVAFAKNFKSNFMLSVIKNKKTGDGEQ